MRHSPTSFKFRSRRLSLGIGRWTLGVGCSLAVLTASASACAVCMGADDPRTVDASNTVLWALLGLVGFIFVATGLTVLFLWRKSLRVPLPSFDNTLHSAVPNSAPGHS